MLAWNEISIIRGLVRSGAKDIQILEVFKFESEKKNLEILKVIDETKKEMSDGKGSGIPVLSR